MSLGRDKSTTHFHYHVIPTQRSGSNSSPKRPYQARSPPNSVLARSLASMNLTGRGATRAANCSMSNDSNKPKQNSSGVLVYAPVSLDHLLQAPQRAVQFHAADRVLLKTGGDQGKQAGPRSPGNQGHWAAFVFGLRPPAMATTSLACSPSGRSPTRPPTVRTKIAFRDLRLAE